jgi:ribosome-associated protein
LISKPSKSARKREHLALQALGERLIGLTREQLDGIGLDERLKDAVLAAQEMRSHGALRRQKQLIGKLMRSVDAAPIEAALALLDRDDREARRVFRDAERWRDRIVGEPEIALTEFLQWTGGTAPAVEECVRTVQRAGGDRDLKSAKRRLFRVIHEEVAQKVQRDASSS